MQKWMIAGAMLLATAANAQNAGYKERAQAYIDKHKMIAMAEQQRTGIPAAITLAQGVLETDAGNSELAVEANNHFGIKCKSTWKGETFAHTDDAPNECFRKYGSTHESYKDHSDFLKQPRYNPLFRIPVTNYEDWAKGLKKFGYATNPRYAQQLIKIIEDYSLQDYTFAANNKDIIYPTEFPEPNPKAGTGVAAKQTTAKPVANTGKTNTAKPATTNTVAATSPELKTVTEVVKAEEKAEIKNAIPEGVEPGKIVRVNGLRAIYALKGDVLLTYAIKHNIRYERMLEINELPDAPLKENMYIFLDKKKTRGMKPTHTVDKGESMMQIAQSEGVQIQALRELNMLSEGEEPAPGAVLNLQRIADEKPALLAKAKPAAPKVAGGNKVNNATTPNNKPDLLDKKTLESNKATNQQLTAAEQKKQAEADRIAANKVRAEEARLAREKAAEEARLERERKAEEQKIIVKTRAEKQAADEQAAKQALIDAENAKKAEALALQEQKAAEARASEEQRMAANKAEQEKQAMATKDAEERALAAKIAADAKAADELRIANIKAAEERREAQAREAEERRIAQEKEAEERRIAEAKAEEERLAAEKAERERKVAEAVEAEKQRIAAEKEEAEKKLAAAKAEEERKLAEAKQRQKNRTVVSNDEPQDEFSKLKSQLDRVVYATDELETEKVKEAEAKKIAELKAQEEKAREQDAKRIAEAKAEAEKKAAAERAANEKKALEAKAADDRRRALEAKAAENSKFYVVKPGDTLAGIAKKNKLTMRQLMEWNNMEWAEVTPGQKLVVKQ